MEYTNITILKCLEVSLSSVQHSNYSPSQITLNLMHWCVVIVHPTGYWAQYCNIGVKPSRFLCVGDADYKKVWRTLGSLMFGPTIWENELKYHEWHHPISCTCQKIQFIWSVPNIPNMQYCIYIYVPASKYATQN